MTTVEETIFTPVAEETKQVEESAPAEHEEEFQDAADAEAGEEDAQDTESSEFEDKEEMEAGSDDAAPDDADVASPAPSAASTVAVANKPADEDRRAEVEKQPYAFERCTVQIAIQLLPEDEDTKGRPVLLGVRTHLDAPILRVLRVSELGELPPAINALVDQLKSELPAREQAARERLEKEALLQKRIKTSRPPRPSKPAKPEKPKTVQTAAAPARSVLTANQIANAVNQAADEKQQLAMF